MVKVRAYTKSDGTKVRKHTRGAPKAAAVITAGAVGVVAIGSGAVDVSLFGGRAAQSAKSANPARSGATAARGATLRLKLRLQQRGHRVEMTEQTDVGLCDRRAYGRARGFLRQHPCESLHRALLEVRHKDGYAILIVLAVTELRDLAAANEFKTLVDTHGTGNVTELSKEIRKYQRVDITGHNYRSHQEGTTVTNVQAEPLARGVKATVLTELATLATTG
ncbi:hypothetical protein EV193_10586 [Herbihabitans rhizosphaerae]|uniref:Uncharacterized protein n=1 Tax=Herbihabitans rhizosphaerae TaxID=1872711 RepID=A0A4Q7KPC7_9PSEU|nr:hypothetical protein [Herbihabitans rhizosphaerae]RZS37531.1 hypothetical protein EV193_10586 [Herbihabitans rhizosphaerae]